MTIPNDQFDPGHDTQSNESPSIKEITADFRRDLAIPPLSEEMVSGCWAMAGKRSCLRARSYIRRVTGIPTCSLS